MKGFRTIAVSLISLVVAMVGGQTIDMTPLQHEFVNLFLALSYSIIILLRIVTDTPVGRKVVDEVAKDIGLSPEMKQELVDLLTPLLGAIAAKFPEGDTTAQLVDSLHRLHASVDEVKSLAAAAATPPGSVTTSTTVKVGDVSQTESVTKAADGTAAMIFTKPDETH